MSRAEELLTKYEKEVGKVRKEINKQSLIERTAEGGDKLGCFIGKYAINPVNGERVPVYIANFVLMYGTGVVMADAHDQRDFEFAGEYGLPVKVVIQDPDKSLIADKMTEAYVDEGTLVNSGDFNGLNNININPDCILTILNWIIYLLYGRGNGVLAH